MENKKHRHNIFRIVLALVFVAFGLVALGNNLGWWDIDDLFLEWWPMILVLIGLVTIFAPGGSWGGGIFLIFLGVIFLLHSHGIYDISELIWPAMLMMVGIMIWPRKKHDPECREKEGEENTHYRDTNEEHIFNINSFFGSRKEIIRDDRLSGGHATAAFGVLKLDLRRAIPKESAYMEVTAVFGGVEIMIPRDWRVVKLGGPVLGNVNDKRDNVSELDFTRTVSIEMNAVFGHVDLMN